ncbi:MAG: cytochrome c3 family protein [bacterium]|nr:cytochrome c3 family protein [bacterium]
MKSTLTFVVAILCFAGLSFAQISGTPHDLSSATSGSNAYYSNQSQICIFCHTPHAASSARTQLWNRSEPAGTFQVYSSPTMNAFDPTGPIPNVTGSSLMCLSCHDGVTALNSLVYNGRHGVPQMTGGNTLTGLANLNDASGLTNDHPVSINYATAAAADAELRPIGTLPGWAIKDGNSIQCSSCHNVHSFGATSDMQPFLNASKTGSALCLQCHIK